MQKRFRVDEVTLEVTYTGSTLTTRFARS